MTLISLPDDVLEKIFSYSSYDEVSRCRIVCQRFNEIGKIVLNHGFHKVENYHNQCLKHVKSQLPRRESERRNHPLARHSDILTAIETRLSLLSMTYKKFIDMSICCFIPGKVLDELYKVLRYVSTVQSPIRTHEVLQELRDLSSMAMEHFDEKIAPDLKRNKDTEPTINVSCDRSIHKKKFMLRNYAECVTGNLSEHLEEDYLRRLPQKISKEYNSLADLNKQMRTNTPTPTLCKMYRFMNELAKRQNNMSSEVSALKTKKKDLESIGKRITDLEKLASESKKKINKSEKLIAKQQAKITQQTAQLYEQDLKIEKLTKLLGEKQAISTGLKKSAVSQRSSKRKLTQEPKCEKSKKRMKRK